MYGPKSDATKGRGVGQFYLVARADGAVPQEGFESELRRLSAAVRKVPPLVEDGAPPQLVGVTQTSGTATGAPGTVFLAIDSVVTEGLQALSGL